MAPERPTDDPRTDTAPQHPDEPDRTPGDPTVTAVPASEPVTERQSENGTRSENGATSETSSASETSLPAHGAGPSPIGPPADKTRRGSAIGRRGQVLIAVLGMALGFAIVAQVRQTSEDELAGLRQDDLVRLLDEITQRNEALLLEADGLRAEREELRSGADASRSTQEYLEAQRVLAGTQPVEGPGVVVTIVGSDGEVHARDLVHMLEEFRNAGAEAIEVSGVRLVATSYFLDLEGDVVADGTPVGPDLEWRVIGNPGTIAGALEIPGGALAPFRAAGASVEVTQRDLVQITAVTQLGEPQFAVPDVGAG